MTGCECDLAGFCKRHGVKKTQRLVDLCKRSDLNYWKAWEEGYGPGQKRSGQSKKHLPTKINSRKPELVGDELHRLLSTFGIKPKEGCSCNNYRIQMNQWGVEGCTKNLNRIVLWLKREAVKQKYPFSNFIARQVVNYCISKVKNQNDKLKTQEHLSFPENPYARQKNS